MSLQLVRRAPVWTEAMDAMLRRYFGRGKTARELAERFGVTEWAVRIRARKLGLRAFRRWTADEDAFLRAHYATMTAHAVGQALGRKADAVRFRVRALGLRKRERATRS
jgi:Zn-dependent peptidase ImmA (M78 family)